MMPVFLLKYWSQIGLGIALALTAWAWSSAKSDRDSLLSTISTVSDARLPNGKPGMLSVKDANATVRNTYAAIAKARELGNQMAEQEASVTIKTERKDAQIGQGVSNDVEAKLAQTQRALVDSRALAAERLRAIRAAGNDQGGGAQATPPYDPEPACQSQFAASCDEVLTLLAAGEDNTTQLVGVLDFYDQMKANHDAAVAELEKETTP